MIIKTILCDIEPETALGFSAKSEEISEYVIEHAEPGSIVLLHVMYDSRVEAVESLSDIVKMLRDEGYKFLTVSELLELNH